MFYLAGIHQLEKTKISMQKVVRLVVPTRQGVTLFLAHDASTPGYRDGIKQQVELGRSVITSDGVAEVLSKEGVKVTPLSKYNIHLDLFKEIGMKPVLPEAVMIGMTADISDFAVRSVLESNEIPTIDLVVIDPSYLIAKRDSIMTKVKGGTPVSFAEAIEAVTPTVYTAVACATKAGRVAVMNEKDFVEVNENIENDAFSDTGYKEWYFGTMNEKAWSKFIAKPVYYIGQVFKALYSKETAQA